jgi:hypothetical protein
VRFDEKAAELYAGIRPPLASVPGKPKRLDYEYKRNGTRNTFLFLEPKAGKRHTLVTRRRTKRDWAYAMQSMPKSRVHAVIGGMCSPLVRSFGILGDECLPNGLDALPNQMGSLLYAPCQQGRRA